MYRVALAKKAKKELARLSKRQQQRVDTALVSLSGNPYAGKKLSGIYKGYYSLRVWPYRIIYSIKKKQLLVIVVRIGHRQGVY